MYHEKNFGKLAAGARWDCLSVAACNVGEISDSSSLGGTACRHNTYLVLDINPPWSFW
ncbi:MAG: hypothetical protein ACLS4Z_01390 [Christensenellaceae bacterium]